MSLLFTLRYLIAQCVTNLRGAMRTPWRFLSLAAVMLVNDLGFFMIWIIYFAHFNTLQGWTITDLANLKGIVTGGWGLAFILTYNARQLAQAFQDGSLDTCLTRPQPVLPSILVGRVSASHFGDLITAPIYWFAFGSNSLSDLPLLLFLTLMSACLMASIVICLQMLVVWMRGTSRTGEQLTYVMLTTATLPQQGYGRWGKIIMYTILPCGFIGMVPVTILRGESPLMIPVLIVAVLFYATLAHFIFQAMLKRYTSATRVGI